MTIQRRLVCKRGWILLSVSYTLASVNSHVLCLFVFINISVSHTKSELQVRDGAGYFVFTDNVGSYLSDTCKRSVCTLCLHFVFDVVRLVLDFVPSMISVPVAMKVFLLSKSYIFLIFTCSPVSLVCVAPKQYFRVFKGAVALFLLNILL